MHGGTRYAPPLRFVPMWSRFLRLVLASVLFVAVFATVPGIASAQITDPTTGAVTGGATLTIYQEQSLPRYNSGHTRQINKRGLQYTPEGVNYEDCLEDQEIEFPLQMSGFDPNATVQVWASTNGTDCSAQTARTGGYQLCWQLITGIPLQLTVPVYIKVRDIMAGASPASPTALRRDVGICGLVDLNTISVQFLYFPPGNPSQASSSQTVTIQVDTVGPAPPSGIHTLPGDTRIYVNWDSISGEGGVTALTGVKIYCDQNGNTSVPSVAQCQRVLDSGIPEVDLSQIGEAGVTPVTTTNDASTFHSEERGLLADGGDAGDDGGDASSIDVTTTDAASSDGATTSSGDANGGTCTNTNFAPTNGNAVVPNADFDSCFLCGTITGNTGTSITASGFRGAPLTNNQHYAVAVAATDAFENVGALSPIYCEYPELTNDFWRTYKNDGGGAGGCDTAGDEAPLGSVAALLGVIVVGLSLVRRKKKGHR